MEYLTTVDAGPVGRHPGLRLESRTAVLDERHRAVTTGPTNLPAHQYRSLPIPSTIIFPFGVSARPKSVSAIGTQSPTC